MMCHITLHHLYERLSCQDEEEKAETAAKWETAVWDSVWTSASVDPLDKGLLESELKLSCDMSVVCKMYMWLFLLAY